MCFLMENMKGTVIKCIVTVNYKNIPITIIMNVYMYKNNTFSILMRKCLYKCLGHEIPWFHDKSQNSHIQLFKNKS